MPMNFTRNNDGTWSFGGKKHTSLEGALKTRRAAKNFALFAAYPGGYTNKLINTDGQWRWSGNGTPGTLQNAMLQSAAVKFFKNKTSLPTQTWRDIHGAAHATAFVSAGAMQTELLNDMKAALDQIVAGGGNVGDFVDQFPDLTKKYGWGLRGNTDEAWRARLIVEMNVNTSFAIANALEARQNYIKRPYASWELGDSKEHRPLHVDESRKKIAVALGSDYYQTHQFPLGFGCRCWWKTWSKSAALKAGYSIKDNADAPPDVIDPGFGGDRLQAYLDSLKPSDVPAAQAAWWSQAIGSVKSAFAKIAASFGRR